MGAHLQEADGAVVEALGRVVEDALQGSLDDGAGSQDALAQFQQALADLRAGMRASPNETSSRSLRPTREGAYL